MKLSAIQTNSPVNDTNPSLSPSVALNVSQLSWCIDGKTILSDINFTLPTGQMLGLIGPNGAGKSSLLRCLYRFVRPTQGKITLLIKILSACRPRRLPVASP